MEQYLSVKNVAKYFGKFQALNNINFDVNEGEFVCILGPSGCGKTTLLRVIAGLESQSEGCLLYTSPSPRDMSASRMPSSA